MYAMIKQSGESGTVIGRFRYEQEAINRARELNDQSVTICRELRGMRLRLNDRVQCGAGTPVNRGW